MYRFPFSRCSCPQTLKSRSGFLNFGIFLAPGSGSASQYGSGTSRAKSMRIHEISDSDPQHGLNPKIFVNFFCSFFPALFFIFPPSFLFLMDQGPGMGKKISVPDPDPHVFWPPGSGSSSQRYGSDSGSGSFYHAKIVRKTLIPTILWLFLNLSLKNDVNVPSKSNMQKKLC